MKTDLTIITNPLFLQIPTILGLDADENGMDPLTFRIADGTPFTIGSDGRTVRTTAVLDREALVAESYMYEVTVVVEDRDALHMSTASLFVTVTDINDNPPCFPPGTITTYSVEENRAIFPDPESSVGTITAMDLDLPLDPQITYFISAGDRGHFDINPDTGEIYVLSSLNREAIQNYTLNITSTDGELTCGIQVLLIILNANDNDPIFVLNPYLGSIIENAFVGQQVDTNFTTTNVPLQLVATDIDQDPIVTYSVVPQPGPDIPFTIDFETGIISSTDTLDRETTDTYLFFVQAFDGLRSSQTLVEIVVLDFNDFPPEFSNASINITIPERTPASFVFLFVEATDNDIGNNSEIRYSILSKSPFGSPNDFGIDPIRGSLFSVRDVVLDPGDPQIVTLIVAASNTLSEVNPPLRALKTVIIAIEDLNMFAPQFDPPHYTFEIFENQNMLPVGTVTAMEVSGDLGTFLSYSIVNTGSLSHTFFQVNNLVSSRVL